MEIYIDNNLNKKLIMIMLGILLCTELAILIAVANVNNVNDK